MAERLCFVCCQPTDETGPLGGAMCAGCTRSLNAFRRRDDSAGGAMQWATFRARKAAAERSLVPKRDVAQPGALSAEEEAGLRALMADVASGHVSVQGLEQAARDVAMSHMRLFATLDVARESGDRRLKEALDQLDAARAELKRVQALGRARRGDTVNADAEMVSERWEYRNTLPDGYVFTKRLDTRAKAVGYLRCAILGGYSGARIVHVSVFRGGVRRKVQAERDKVVEDLCKLAADGETLGIERAAVFLEADTTLRHARDHAQRIRALKGVPRG